MQPHLAIQAIGIKKSFGKVEALKGVDLVLVKGTVLALLGPNGAGKTTLVRVLATLLRPDSGQAQINGFDLEGEAQNVRASIGLSGQFASVDDILTARENIELVGKLYHLPEDELIKRTEELLDLLEIREFADRRIKTYSGGMRRRLDLALALIASPPVIFLDEPTTGLDPKSRMGMWKIIKELSRTGTSVLLTTQYLEEADKLADWIVVIDHGRVIAQGSSRELKSKIGGDVLEIHLTNPEKVVTAARALLHLGNDKPQIDEEQGKIALPISGTAAIPEVIRTLDSLQITIADLAMHQPTLDDVFLSLTGHSTELKEGV
ncbi:MAG: ATP-binding cassette domain-containing protein [bacterium]|nr:ATP-binding cassette domain-containing protein [bacterium]